MLKLYIYIFLRSPAPLLPYILREQVDLVTQSECGKDHLLPWENMTANSARFKPKTWPPLATANNCSTPWGVIRSISVISAASPHSQPRLLGLQRGDSGGEAALAGTKVGPV